MVMCRVYIRLAGLKCIPRDGHPEVNHAYAPTFNVHEELVRYHVSSPLHLGPPSLSLMALYVALASRQPTMARCLNDNRGS